MNKRKNTQPPVMVDANVTRSALADAVIGVACTIDTIYAEREGFRQEITTLRQEIEQLNRYSGTGEGDLESDLRGNRVKHSDVTGMPAMKTIDPGSRGYFSHEPQAFVEANNRITEERDVFAARCTSLEETNEGLEKLLRNCRDNYVEPELRLERITFKGHENCSNIPALESDLAEINAALSPPASDAADSGRVCKCNLRTKLVGDGCHICNPEYAAQFDDDGSEPLAAGVAG